MKTWYLLYDGSSPDGRGDAKYIGRTVIKKEAERHHEKTRKNPYSTGYVMAVTDDSAGLLEIICGVEK